MTTRTNHRLVNKSHSSLRGFTLTELMVVLAIMALLLVFTLPATTAMMNAQKRKATVDKMRIIETALANYVAINRRLPCPADGTDVTSGLAGVELRTPANTNFGVFCQAIAGNPANNNQQTGVVPWRTLGITAADALDGWDYQITYRVGYGLTQDGGLDMSACDPVGTAATTPNDVVVPSADTSLNTNFCNPALSCSGTGTTCTNPQKFIVNKGLGVINGSGSVLMDPRSYTGAAYVLISHGDNAMGAYSISGQIMTSPMRGVNGTLEANNHNNGRAVSSASTTDSPQFRDATFSESTDTALYFDDVVVRPTVFSLIQRAQLGPRTH